MSEGERVPEGTTVQVRAFFKVVTDSMDGDMLLFDSMSECDKLEALDDSGVPQEVEYDEEGRLFYKYPDITKGLGEVA